MGSPAMRVKAILGAFLLSGCLGPGPQPPAYWTMESAEAHLESTTRAPIRLGLVKVRVPYDGMRLAVLRADGSLAFDPCNSFAARPEDLVGGVAADMFASGRAAPGGGVVDVTATRIALDCRTEGRRIATVELVATLREGRGESRTVRLVKGAAAIDADDGNYTRAFSQALVQALGEVLANLGV